jgi:hypothetical protein
MLMLKERRPPVRAVERWAIRVLLEAGAIKECDEHGYMQCRGDPHARDRARMIAREELPPGLDPDAAGAALQLFCLASATTVRNVAKSHAGSRAIPAAFWEPRTCSHIDSH